MDENTMEEGDIPNRLAQSIQLLDSSRLTVVDMMPRSVSVGEGGVRGPSHAEKTSLGVGKRPYTPRYVRHASFDVSSYLSPTVFGYSALEAPNLALSAISEDRQIKDEQTEVKDNSGQQRGAEAFLETSDSSILVASMFYDEFFQSLQENPAETQVFSLINSFARLCDDKLHAIGKLLPKLPYNQSKWRRAMAVKRVLQNEANTWELVHTLYWDRLLRPADADTQEMELAVADNLVGKRVSEKEYVEVLYERHSALRQSQLVVSWLEHIAAKEIQDNAYDRYEFFSNKRFCWEATLNALNEENGTPASGMECLVTELDPDAPLRQQRSLACLDKENRLSFLKCLFLYIRTGQLDQAVRLCEHYGEHWRAATLQGWCLYHDPNYSDLNGADNKVRNTDGNPLRGIWKSACWALSEEECVHPLERAVYAALCGNLDRVLVVCTTWEERMWAHFRSMIDVRIETALRMHWSGRGHRRGNDAALNQLPAAYWQRTQTPESVFHELQSSTNADVQNDSLDRFREIQKYIILDDVEGLLQNIYEKVQCGEKDAPHDHHPHFVRFAAHLVIFLRTVACCSSKEDLCDAILEEYVKVLVCQRRLRLVPAYTAKLPPKQQVFWYARFLEGIKKREEQQLCLRLAEEYSLDVALITRTVVENARNKGSRRNGEQEKDEDAVFGDSVGISRSEITNDDQTKIDAIDWLIFVPLQRLEAVRQANALTRAFLATQKIDAARAVFNKIPPDSIDTILKQWQTQERRTKFGESPAVIDNTTREYLCLQAYLQAQDSFGDWFEHFHHGKPEAPPPPPPSGAPFAERMSQEHKQAQYVADMDRWRHTLDLQTRITVGKMYNVLLFVDGGWMVDRQLPVSGDDEERIISIARLREVCLPQVVILLHSVLYSTGRFKEALDLADVVASEQHKLYKVFRKPELHRFLLKLRDSSLRLLDENLDSMGYPIQ